MHSNLCRHSYEQRANVQRGAALVCRYIVLVEAHHLGNHLLEKLRRHFRHKYAAASTLQTRRVLVHTEHTHLAVGTTVSLKALERFLTVMQACRGHVHLDILV